MLQTTKKPFTIEVALNMQLTDITRWSTVLTVEAYQKLLNTVIEKNAKGYNSPYDVCRGQDITSIVTDITYQLIK